MCKYCDGSLNDIAEKKANMGFAGSVLLQEYISDNKLILYAAGSGISIFEKKIKYCPMCGRNLSEP